jgi:hypothetical protein
MGGGPSRGLYFNQRKNNPQSGTKPAPQVFEGKFRGRRGRRLPAGLNKPQSQTNGSARRLRYSDMTDPCLSGNSTAWRREVISLARDLPPPVKNTRQLCSLENLEMLLRLVLIAAGAFGAPPLAVGASDGPDQGEKKVSFLNEVMPIFAKAGCNSGGCHAKPEGQSNFKLSVFGYDPKADYREVVSDVRGRRLFFAAPEQSLLLLKASARIPHEGGERLPPGSEWYRTVLKWIQQGAPFDAPETARLERVEVTPAKPVLGAGGTTRLQVTAHFSDGSRKNVSAMALYQSNDKDLFAVDDSGVVSAGAAQGEGVVVVNYMGFVDVVRPVVPPAKPLAAADFERFSVRSPVDSLIYARLQGLGILPSEPCTDAEFIRRSSLDCIGKLPTAEQAEAFLSDRSPDKRSRWIDAMLNDPNYADHWAVKWGDLIRPNPYRVGVKPVFLLDQWLREAFQKNLPYDAMARAILTAQGSSHQHGPVAVVRDKRDPVEAASFVSQIFLGVRLECAKCHHHPSEKWTQEDYYQLAAFFGKMRSRGQGISAPISGEVELWWYDSNGKGVTHPVTDAPMVPKVPDGAEFPYEAGVDPRATLVDWMVSPENPFFAKAIVNRIWNEFMGRGIVEPVDDFRTSNPPTNPELLEWLAADFIQHKFDLKHLMRTILESAAYQRSSLPNDSNLADQRNFSKATRRRLPAEVLLDAVGDFTGVRDAFAGLAPGSRAVQTWNHKLSSDFMDAFGRPNSSLECPCERERKPTLVQSLHLMNSTQLQAKLTSPKGRVAQWAASSKPAPEIVRSMYLSAFCREPDKEEMDACMAHLGKSEATQAEAFQDLVWTLINSAEFVFNH